MKVNKLNSLVELYFKKCDEVDSKKSFLKGKTLGITEYLAKKLKIIHLIF